MLAMDIGIHGEAGAERTKVSGTFQSEEGGGSLSCMRGHNRHRHSIPPLPIFMKSTWSYCPDNTCDFIYQIQPANVVVERMINQIISQENGYQYFKAVSG